MNFRYSFPFPLMQVRVFLISTLLTALAIGCSKNDVPMTSQVPDKTASPTIDSGHENMRDVLARIAAAARDQSPFIGDRKVRELRSLMTVLGFRQRW